MIDDVLTQRFAAYNEVLKNEMLEEINKLEISSMAIKWIERMLDYNTSGGKMNRGLFVVSTGLKIVGDKVTSEQFQKLLILGWCIEWLQASFLMGDDIMDNSITRRGQICWYKREEVGMIAINDCFILQSFLFNLIRRHFSSEKYYIDLVHLFMDVKMKTELGQAMDLVAAPADGSGDIGKFSPDLYEKIAIYKTSFYSFYLPFLCSLMVAGIEWNNFKESVERFLLELGVFFQIQDDYLDYYGDPSVLGKVGTDIRDGKCSWLINMALLDKGLTEEDRQTIKDNYGRADDTCEERVGALFMRLNLEEKYHMLERDTKLKLEGDLRVMDLDCVESSLIKEALQGMIEKIFGRKK